jgi:hypothetical protein
MQFVILKSKYLDNSPYTIIYKEEDIYYYSSSKISDMQVYWNHSIQNVLNNSIIKIITDSDTPAWIKYVAINDIVWLDIDKPEYIPTQYPELFI